MVLRHLNYFLISFPFLVYQLSAHTVNPSDTIVQALDAWLVGSKAAIALMISLNDSVASSILCAISQILISSSPDPCVIFKPPLQ